MACPHVSGVLALGISYAAELRRHFRADELRDLLYATAVDIDAYMVGTKKYCRYVADVGPIQPMQIVLGDYVGMMGAGQVNAAAFLAAIADSGVEMRFPNLSLAEGQNLSVAPARYFVGGEELTFSVTIENAEIASSKTEGAKILFTGLKSGATQARIKASNGEEHTFNITVRKQSADNGWL